RVKLRRGPLHQCAGANPDLAVFVLGRRHVVPVQYQPGGALAERLDPMRFDTARSVLECICSHVSLLCLHPVLMVCFDSVRRVGYFLLCGRAIFSCIEAFTAPGMALASLPSILVSSDAA